MFPTFRPDEDLLRIPDPVSPEIFEQILQFVYFRSCDLLQAPSSNVCHIENSKNKKSGRKNSENGNNEFLKVSGGDPSKVSAFKVYSENGKNSERSSKKSGNQPKASNPVTSLVEASKLFGMTNLTKILMDKNCRNQKSEIRFNRKSYPEFHDVVIRTEDGAEIAAHRCVLAARLDYFKSVTFPAHLN